MQGQRDTGIASALQTACTTTEVESLAVDGRGRGPGAEHIRMRAVVRRRATRAERRLRPPGALSPAAAMLRSAFGCLRSHGFSAISTSITNNPDGTTDIEMRATARRKDTDA